MRNEADIETYWERELGEPVTILAMGWVHAPTDFALYIGGTFMVAFKRLGEIESWLETYFMKREA